MLRILLSVLLYFLTKEDIKMNTTEKEKLIIFLISSNQNWSAEEVLLMADIIMALRKTSEPP